MSTPAPRRSKRLSALPPRSEPTRILPNRRSSVKTRTSPTLLNKPPKLSTRNVITRSESLRDPPRSSQTTSAQGQNRKRRSSQVTRTSSQRKQTTSCSVSLTPLSRPADDDQANDSSGDAMPAKRRLSRTEPVKPNNDTIPQLDPTHPPMATSTSSESADSSPDDRIIGRVKERQQLNHLVQQSIDSRQSVSIYVSGAPGTGKTAVVLHELSRLQLENRSRRHLFSINCMQLTTAASIFRHLFDLVASRDFRPGQSDTSMAATIEHALCATYPSDAVVMLVLDEVDQLVSKQQDVLYRIFDWPATLSCHLILVGIANALDLPERLLPRLKAKHHRPVHLTFPPYSREELGLIVGQHLTLVVGQASDMDPLAIQLCARKIAAASGDARTAVSVCRRAVDLAQLETRIQSKAGTTYQTPRPTLKHVMAALKEMRGVDGMITNSILMPRRQAAADLENCPPPSSIVSPTPLAIERLCQHQQANNLDLPLHHKLVVACFQLARENQPINVKPHRDLAFSRLYDIYSTVCKRRHLAGLDESELLAVCDFLEARGLIEPARSSAGGPKLVNTPARMRRHRLRIDGSTVRQLLCNDMLLSGVLNIKL